MRYCLTLKVSLLAWLILDEQMSTIGYIGMFIVVVGAVMLSCEVLSEKFIGKDEEDATPDEVRLVLSPSEQTVQRAHPSRTKRSPIVFLLIILPIIVLVALG